MTFWLLYTFPVLLEVSEILVSFYVTVSLFIFSCFRCIFRIVLYVVRTCSQQLDISRWFFINYYRFYGLDFYIITSDSHWISSIRSATPLRGCCAIKAFFHCSYGFIWVSIYFTSTLESPLISFSKCSPHLVLICKPPCNWQNLWYSSCYLFLFSLFTTDFLIFSSWDFYSLYDTLLSSHLCLLDLELICRRFVLTFTASHLIHEVFLEGAFSFFYFSFLFSYSVPSLPTGLCIVL